MMAIYKGKIFFEYGDTTRATNVASVRKSVLDILYAAELKNIKQDINYANVVKLGLQDKVLDSAVATDLKQSPYLSFLSPARAQETLSQMQQKKDAALTPVLAREVCLRNNAQVVLRGVVARFGKRYLLTLDATDCVSGDVVASSKSEAAAADDIPTPSMKLPPI